MYYYTSWNEYLQYTKYTTYVEFFCTNYILIYAMWLKIGTMERIIHNARCIILS